MNAGQLTLVSVNFTLYTEVNASTPEFTITCFTRGGPATYVEWKLNREKVDGNHTSKTQHIFVLSDRYNKAEYQNKLFVRGRKNGTYSCDISNNIRQYLPMVPTIELQGNITVIGIIITLMMH